jgi:hypothetical protein
MSDQERETQEEETEREETIKDVDVSEEEGEDVAGGRGVDENKEIWKW